MTAQISPRTVVEAFLPRTGTVATDVIHDAANAVDIADQTIRLAIRRMTASGTLEQHGRGRNGTLTLTEQGRAEFDRDRLGLALALGQDAGEHLWDGNWYLTAISTPESERPLRDALRRRLRDAGAAPASTGLFVSPHDLLALLPANSSAYIVSAAARSMSVRGVSEPTALVELLWPAGPIDGVYDVLAAALDHDGLDDAPIVRRLHLADSLDRALRKDPLIPPELRPRGWRPSALRRAWTERWDSIPCTSPALFDGWL